MTKTIITAKEKYINTCLASRQVLKLAELKHHHIKEQALDLYEKERQDQVK